MTADYTFLTIWRVAGTIDEVKAVLGDAQALPRWWPSVYLTVTTVADAGADGTGATVDLHTTGWLPYTLRWRLRITEPMTDSGFALSGAGDLNGSRAVDLRAGRPRGADQLRLARERRQALAAKARLAAEAGVRRQSSVGDGARRGEPAPRAPSSEDDGSGRRRGAGSAATSGDVRLVEPMTRTVRCTPCRAAR